MKSFVFKVNLENDVCVTTKSLKDATQFLDGHPEFDIEAVSSLSIYNADPELESVITEYGRSGHAHFYKEGEVWNEWF